MDKFERVKRWEKDNYQRMAFINGIIGWSMLIKISLLSY